MIAADDDRRFQLAAAHHFVERKAEFVPLAVAEPADARRKPLERDALARHLDPAAQMIILREHANTSSSVLRMSSGSPESAAQRNGPLPSQNNGRI